MVPPNTKISMPWETYEHAGHDAEQVDVELVHRHRSHGVSEGDGLELDVATLFLEIAKLVGENRRGDLDELASDSAHEMLALALAHEGFFLGLLLRGIIFLLGARAAGQGASGHRGHRGRARRPSRNCGE